MSRPSLWTRITRVFRRKPLTHEQAEVARRAHLAQQNAQGRSEAQSSIGRMQLPYGP